MGVDGELGGRGRARRLVMWLCLAALIVSVLPLYAISLYDHPYYDDYNFSKDVHNVWRDTGSVGAVLEQAVKSAQDVRRSWQGTYLGTILSNVQPGVFGEQYYFIGCFFLLTAFLACFGAFYYTLFHGLCGLCRAHAVSLGCGALFLTVQFLPDVGEAFFWFNGGIGNTFVYSLIALALVLGWWLCHAGGARAVALTAVLALLMVALGGGSYGGGLMTLCLGAALILWLFVRRHPRRWIVAALWLVLLACFLYSAAAPGNSVRADAIGYVGSPVKAVAQALYQGMALIGGYVRLPVLAVTLVALPLLLAAARNSRFSFKHPWLVTLAGYLLYCTQLVPPLYSIASLGDGRIMDSYYISFIALWFGFAYYMAGYAARKWQQLPQLDLSLRRGLALTAACMMLVGCLGFKRADDKLYGAQNLSGASAALSLITGEAQAYHADMSAREALLNDETQPVVTLAPLTRIPSVFMRDLYESDDVEGVRRALERYYGKQAILLAGEEVAP